MKAFLLKDNDFYRNHYHHIIMMLIGLIVLLLLLLALVMFQLLHRPLPVFNAVDPDNKKLALSPSIDPNLLPATLIRWASKAAITAYNFDWVNYKEQISFARPYFTEGGWNDYLLSINAVITSVVQGQLFVNGVVSGTPVISNQGPLSGHEQVWRIQIPFLVTYQSANTTTKRNFIVSVMLVRIPTFLNSQGIGIDQFVMTEV